MLYKILETLKKNNEFISGEQLAEKFLVSRAYICKNISKLKKMGYNIKAISNRGYLLVNEQDVLNSFEVEYNNKAEFIGRKCHFFDELDSTNNKAKQLAENNVPEGEVILTLNQITGRGRRNNIWFSSKNKNILFSLILRPKISIDYSYQITLLIGVAICKAINNFLNLDAKIKWPNDIIINNKKVCGILTEVSAEIDQIKYAIVGIGINVNEENFEDNLEKKATSLKIELNRTIKRSDLIKEIFWQIEQIYKQYCKNFDFLFLLDEYKRLCLNIGKRVKVITHKSTFLANVLDINDKGELVLKLENDSIMVISCGEVYIRNFDGSYV